MPKTFAALFETRREAEMTVEKLVQEHGLPADAIEIAPEEAENSAGIKLDGSDRENSGDKAGSPSHPSLSGRLKVSVVADEASADTVMAAFAAHGGKPVS